MIASDLRASPTVIFISGYGRSGSTLLDMFLSSRLEGVFGAGELANLFDELELGARCECGAKIGECEVWSPVVDLLPEQGLSLAKARAVTIDGHRILGHAGETYFTLWRAVLARLRAVTGCEVIVDSSKVTRTRFAHATRLHAMGQRLVVLHLVREPDDVVASTRMGSNKAIERGQKTGGSLHVLRSIVGWLVGNLGTEHLVRRTGAPRRLVRYEALVESEDYRRELLEWVAREAGVAPNGTAGPMISRGHGVSGNRLRRMGGGPIELKRVRAAKSSHPVDRATAGLLWLTGRALGYYERR